MQENGIRVYFEYIAENYVVDRNAWVVTLIGLSLPHETMDLSHLPAINTKPPFGLLKLVTAPERSTTSDETSENRFKFSFGQLRRGMSWFTVNKTPTQNSLRVPEEETGLLSGIGGRKSGYGGAFNG